MTLPTSEQINVHDSLDEQHACKTFLGKTLEQAAKLFQENALRYQEDLMWMGPIAFRYYVPAFIGYIQSQESKGDSDAINCFAGLLEFRLEHEPKELSPIALELAAACRHVIEHYDHFDASLEVYGDLRSRYEKLIQQLSPNS